MNSLMDKFIKYAKEQFGYDISLTEADTPDTFESLFGVSFITEEENTVVSYDEKFIYKNDLAIVANMDTVYLVELNADIKKNIISIGNHEYNVILTTTIEKDDMNIELVAEAQFLYESEDYSREESIINTNTVAIMFPFIRSQVTLLTSQPGMVPIILPPINTQKLR